MTDDLVVLLDLVGLHLAQQPTGMWLCGRWPSSLPTDSPPRFVKDSLPLALEAWSRLEPCDLPLLAADASVAYRSTYLSTYLNEDRDSILAQESAAMVRGASVLWLSGCRACGCAADAAEVPP